MTLTQADPLSPVADPSRAILNWLHQLLIRPAVEQPGLEDLLAELAAVFQVRAAGLVGLPDGSPLLHHPSGLEGPWPWESDPDLLARVGQTATALTVLRPLGGSMLLTAQLFPDGSAWLLWLADERESWDEGTAAALALVLQVLARRSGSGAAPPWSEHLDRLARQQRLEAVALVTRRLAHDFGNVLTGILGFTELALAQQIPSSTPLHSHLQEVHRAAQGGAQFINQLRLFSRRQAGSSRPSTLAPILAEEEARSRSACEAGLQLQILAPDDLPPVNMASEHLRMILGALLDNGREAVAGSGTVIVSARVVELSASDCLELYGSARPGTHVEVCVADTGGGLSPDVQRRLFSEPFITTRPRRRGFGLSVAYGLLHAQHGGIRLYQGERGVVARFVVPVAPTRVVPSHLLGQEAGTSLNGKPGERVLVVDDDPLILRLVSTTLEQAGYRVEAVSNAEDALQSYFSHPGDPFRLVLSDVLMPRVNGVDLARRLLKRDANARVMFMSGQVSHDFTQAEFIQSPFELLTKPFHPEGLLRAVRSALDCPLAGSRTRIASPGGTGEGPVVSSIR
jgi:signal transduction histidine kinase/ActR/RegA family two-component response regulator